MECTFFFLVLLSYCSGFSSQAVWTQPPSQTVSLGQTAKLPCTVSGAVFNFQWHRQRPGEGPHFVIQGNIRGEGIPDRFTHSSSGSVHYLTITNVQREDEANYYCVVLDGRKYVFGGGTTLSVTGGSPVPPNVHLYPPSPEEIESKGKATFVCLIDGFSPPGITVTWQADSNTISSGVETTKPTKVNEKYVSSSYLTLDPSVWKSSNHVTCKVTHERNDYEKSVSHAKCP